MRELYSQTAIAIGITTMTEAKRAFLAQAPFWWLGRHYSCPVCGDEFRQADDAAAHLLGRGHPVLRADAPPFVDADPHAPFQPVASKG